VSVDQPGQIWRVETGSLTDPQFTELAFIP
jgi:hypothetical protein